jgi:hypothetical protein
VNRNSASNARSADASADPPNVAAASNVATAAAANMAATAAANMAAATAAATVAATAAATVAATTATTTATPSSSIGFDREKRSDEEESRRDAKTALERPSGGEEFGRCRRARLLCRGLPA